MSQPDMLMRVPVRYNKTSVGTATIWSDGSIVANVDMDGEGGVLIRTLFEVVSCGHSSGITIDADPVPVRPASQGV